jgi:type II secretory pathway pseudopilin PulG
MVNWATALNCKRCAYFFQTAETSIAADATVAEAAPVQNTFVEQAPVDTHYSPNFNKPAFDTPPIRANNQESQQNYGQNQQYDQSYNQNQQQNQQYNQNYGQNYYQQPNYQQNFAAPANQKIGLAVTSMILGILGMVTAIFLIGILLAPVGLIFGIIALVKIKNKPNQYGGKGFAIAGVVTSAMITLFIPIVMAIAIPNLLAARKAANESFAVSVLYNLADAESTYRSGTGKGACADLKTLAASNVVDSELVKGEKNGYRFNIVNYPLGGCEITATPVSVSTGTRSFYYSTDDNQIRAARKNGKPAEKSDNLLKDDYKEEAAEQKSQTESQNVIPNESIALSSLVSIHSAESTYISTVGQGECCGDFKSLADMGLIKPGLADGEDAGYRFKITNLAKGNYQVTATPISTSYGSRSFFKSPLEGLRGASKNGLPADKNDPPVDNY